MRNVTPETGAFFTLDRQWHPKALTPDYKTSVTRSPQRVLISIPNGISEITGPVFGHDLLGERRSDSQFRQDRRKRHW